MKIALGQVWQETNTFNPILTTMETFRNFGYVTDADLLTQFREVSELGGFIAAGEADPGPIDWAPLIRVGAWPSGPVTAEARAYFQRELLERLERAWPLDGVLLSLHGAMVAQDADDVEGELLTAVRECVGPNVPVAASLDLHANVTERMVAAADLLCGYHTAPHVDLLETGEKTARLLFAVARGQARPVTAFRKLPMIVPAERHITSEGPMKDLFDRVKAEEQRAGVLSVSLFPVQPWLDLPDLGWSVLATTDGDEGLAQQIVDGLAEMAWAYRDRFDVERLPPGEAIDRAWALDGRPVVIADAADSTNSGAPGDSTILLRELLAREPKEPVFLTVVDPEAVEQALTAGVGAEVELDLGGKRDSVFSQPVRVTARVRLHFDGRYRISGHGGKNLAINTGRTVLLEVGEIRIVVSEAPGPGHHPKVYETVGLNPREAKIVIVKSPSGFRADYGPFAREIFLADCPGLASPHFEQLPYRRIPRPLYPFDE